jgi:hypothetical protein
VAARQKLGIISGNKVSQKLDFFFFSGLEQCSDKNQ